VKLNAVDRTVFDFQRHNLAIRLPFILLHLLNATMIYVVSRRNMRGSDAFLAALLFAALPGVNSAALLVSMAPFLMGVALVYVWLYERSRLGAIALLFFAAIADNSFIALIVAAASYEFYRKRFRVAAIVLIFAALSYALYGFEFSGRPRGYFLDIFGLYGAIFSPLVLCYFLYSLYWYAFKNAEKLTPLWFVCAVPFAASIVLSLRQNLPIEDYAPFAAISAPLMIRAFMNSWRIRLPQFRASHIAIASIMAGSLLLFTALTFFHAPLYALTGSSERYFAKEHHFADELALRLKARGIYSARCDTKSLTLRLQFYGIEEGGEYRIYSKREPIEKREAIEFYALGSRVAVFYLTDE
jgi:hypothetical protein